MTKSVKYLYIISLSFLLNAYAMSLTELSPTPSHKIAPEWSFSGAFTSVAISGDGSYIIAGTGSYVHLFEKSSNVTLWSVEEHARSYGLSISSNGTYMCVASQSHLHLFRRNSATPLWSYQFSHLDYGVEDIRTGMSNDGSHIVAIAELHAYQRPDVIEVYMFDISSPVPRYRALLQEQSLQSFSISADGEYFVVGVESGYDLAEGKIYVYSWEEKSILWTYTAKHCFGTAISGDGRYILYSAATPYKDTTYYAVYFFSVDSPTPIWRHLELGGMGHHVVSLSFNGSYAIASGYQSYTHFFSTDTNETLNAFGDQGYFNAITDDGSYAMTAGIGFPSRIRVWKLVDESYELFWSLTLPEDNDLDGADMSSDGRYTVAATERALFLFDNTKAKPIVQVSLLEQPWFWFVMTLSGVALLSILLFAIKKRKQVQTRGKAKE